MRGRLQGALNQFRPAWLNSFEDETMLMKKTVLRQFSLLTCCCGLCLASYAQLAKPTPTPVKRPTTTAPGTTAPATAKPAATTAKPKPTPSVTDKPAAGTPGTVAPDQKPEVTAEQLIAQGKALFKTNKHPQALAKFEAALKLEPERDEALALAADLAYRLDDQPKARTLFLRRAELSNQKDSIRAYCFYRAALAYWREAHDGIAMNGTLKDGQTTYKLPEKTEPVVEEQLTSGLYYNERALTIASRFAEAHTLKSLLHSEQARIAKDDKKAAEQQKLALAALRQAFSLNKDKDPGTLAADFGTPTILLGEFAATAAEEEKTPPVANNLANNLIEGGTVQKRTAPIFPSVRPASNAEGDAATGVTKDGGAYSLGSGRGALTAAYTPGKVKVEVLISTTGEVVFAHVVDGRSDLNAAAVIAARKWKFNPATFEGKPVQLSGVITFDMKPGGRATPTPTPKPEKP